MKSKNFLFSKIFRTIFIYYTLSVLILIFLYSLVMIPMQRETNIEVMHSEAKTLASSISLICADAMITEDDSFIVEHNLAVVNKNKNIYEIIVSKTSGEYLAAKHNNWTLAESIPNEFKKLEKNHATYAILYDKNIQKDVFHYVYPVNVSGINWGWIHISYYLDTYNQKMQNIYKSIIILLATLFIATLLVSYLIARYITSPILKLRASATLVANGNLSERVQIKRDDEIGELARDFNTMITQLENTQNKLQHSHFELEQKVNERTVELLEKTKELEQLNEELDVRIKDAVSKNSEQEQMLIQQSRLAAMGEMIGNIAHQWRQPLNALSLILQNLYYAQEAGELDEEYLQRSMQKGKKLTENMSKTIDDFRNFFQPNKISTHFNIYESVESAYDLVSASFKNNNICVDILVDKNIEIDGYPNEFAQVLLNLLTNAKDALKINNIQNPCVTISSNVINNTVYIDILDNAGGIDESILTKIFDPYFTTKDKDAGTGIGLYMSKMIIENNMGGKIVASNDKTGAKFTISLPLNKGK